jgi:hypothetical protein
VCGGVVVIVIIDCYFVVVVIDCEVVVIIDE